VIYLQPPQPPSQPTIHALHSNDLGRNPTGEQETHTKKPSVNALPLPSRNPQCQHQEIKKIYFSSGSAPTMPYCPPAPAKTIFLSRMALLSMRVGASMSSVVPWPVW